MIDILLQYVLPLFMLSMFLFIVSVRISSCGGPVGVFLRFFTILFAPSLVYAAIADDSSSTLLLLSLAFAIALEGWLWLLRSHNQTTGNRRFGDDQN